MKLRVDSAKCDGYGRCVEIAPDLFELDEWGYASALDGEVPPDQEDLAAQAARECPVAAVIVEVD
jgi:ferredoxin